MNRTKLAEELGVWPWNVDDWLLWGCPARKMGKDWEFDLEKVTVWLDAKNILPKGMKPRHSPSFAFDERWFRGRCPICVERGFPGGKAGRVYTLGEVSQGEWHLRRTGIPCGHSVYVPHKAEEREINLIEKLKRGSGVSLKRRAPLGTFDRTPEVGKDKIAMLKKAIADGTYEIRADDIAGKILKNFLLQCALIPSGGEYAGGRNKQNFRR